MKTKPSSNGRGQTKESRRMRVDQREKKKERENEVDVVSRWKMEGRNTASHQPPPQAPALVPIGVPDHAKPEREPDDGDSFGAASRWKFTTFGSSQGRCMQSMELREEGWER